MAETENSRWNHSVLERNISYDFTTMSCTVSDDAPNREAHIDPDALEEWDADLGDLERAGWTRAEYISRSLAAFDIRRKEDGDWEARPKERFWRRSIDRLKRALGGPMRRTSDKEDFKKLTGEDYDTASARAIEILERIPPPPWESMGDVSPIVELAYQEYRSRA